MPPKAKQIRPSVDSLEGRIAWLMEKVWQGNQTVMGKALGVHPGSISNILRGVRPPGREFLGLLAAHPLVNDRWLLEGIGEPLRSTSRLLGGDTALPVVDTPLPGPPGESPSLLGTSYFPVYQYLYRPSRYWLTVSSDCAWVRSAVLRIAANDRILIEPDSANWPATFLERLCIAVTNTGVPQFLYAVNKSAKSRTAMSSDLELFGQLTEHTPEIALEEDYGKERGAVVLDTTMPKKKFPVVPVTIVGLAVYRCGEC
jgi:hypothetical protein